MPSIQKSRILVIGGSSGIGLAVAQKALQEGAEVHIASSNAARVDASTKELSQNHPEGQVSGHTIDLASNEVEQHLETLLQAVGQVDHVVFTAGDALLLKPLSEAKLDMIHRAGHVRFAVPLLLAKLAPRFLKPGYTSSLVLTSGTGSEKPYPGWSLVAGYLAGMHGLVRSLAVELKPLRVNLVSPGAVATPLWGEQGVPEQVVSSTLLGKVGTAEEVAEAYVYLMKDGNATGSVVNTNSGALLS